MKKDESREGLKAKATRVAILTVGTTGLLALTAEAAHAGINMQHCEPLVRS